MAWKKKPGSLLLHCLWKIKLCNSGTAVIKKHISEIFLIIQVLVSFWFLKCLLVCAVLNLQGPCKWIWIIQVGCFCWKCQVPEWCRNPKPLFFPSVFCCSPSISSPKIYLTVFPLVISLISQSKVHLHWLIFFNPWCLGNYLDNRFWWSCEVLNSYW